MVLLFAEDTLCVEDFSTKSKQGLNVYPKLEGLAYTEVQVYLPHVHAPMNVLYDLPKQGPQWQHSILLPGGLDTELGALDPEDRYLLITFEDSNETESRMDMLKRHDSFMYVTYEKLKENRNVLAIYTALMSSWPRIGEAKLRRNRDVDEEVSTTTSLPEPVSTSEPLSPVQSGRCSHNYCIYGQNDSIMIYASPAPTLTHNGEDISLNDHYTFYVETVDEPEDPVIAEQTLCVIYNAVTLRFHFSLSATNYWIMDDICVEITTTKDNVSLTYMGTSLIQAPLRMSYHCSVVNNTIFTCNSTILSFQTFQVQAVFNGDKIMKFHVAYDCVPFMTTAILSCLCITVPLGLIFLCGVSMILGIKTMDRFDDSKGKTISTD